MKKTVSIAALLFCALQASGQSMHQNMNSSIRDEMTVGGSGMSANRIRSAAAEEAGATPPSITANLVGWWDAGYEKYTDTGCTTPANTDGDDVKCWKNLVEGSTEKFYPISAVEEFFWTESGLNGLPSMYQNGAQEMKVDYSLGSNFTLFVVYDYISDKAGTFFTLAGPGAEVLLNTTVSVINNRNNAGDRYSLSVLDQDAVVDFRSTGTGASDYQLRENCVAFANDGVGGFTPEYSGFKVMNRDVANEIQGYISKIYLYNTNLSDADRTTICNELKTEYGL